MRSAWWNGAVVALVLSAIIAGMWWWGFDFGQVFGGTHRKELEARIAALDAEAAKLRAETGELRTRTSQLESDLAMSRGAEQAMTRQTADLAAENAQLKEQATFWQKLAADAGAQAALSIPKLQVTREREGVYRYSLLLFRSGNPVEDFEGHLVLQAVVASTTTDSRSTAVRTLTFPDDHTDAKEPLTLKFRQYQRVEGELHIPADTRLTSLTARAFENGNASPRASRSLMNP